LILVFGATRYRNGADHGAAFDDWQRARAWHDPAVA
jgi:hypothetical protein